MQHVHRAGRQQLDADDRRRGACAASPCRLTPSRRVCGVRVRAGRDPCGSPCRRLLARQQHADGVQRDADQHDQHDDRDDDRRPARPRVPAAPRPARSPPCSRWRSRCAAGVAAPRHGRRRRLELGRVAVLPLELVDERAAVEPEHVRVGAQEALRERVARAAGSTPRPRARAGTSPGSSCGSRNR